MQIFFQETSTSASSSVEMMLNSASLSQQLSLETYLWRRFKSASLNMLVAILIFTLWTFIAVSIFDHTTRGVPHFSMTTLLTHTVAHSTKPSFMPKTNNQPPKKFLSLALSCTKVVKNGKILTFKVNFLCQKISESF